MRKSPLAFIFILVLGLIASELSFAKDCDETSFLKVATDFAVNDGGMNRHRSEVNYFEEFPTLEAKLLSLSYLDSVLDSGCGDCLAAQELITDERFKFSMQAVDARETDLSGTTLVSVKKGFWRNQERTLQVLPAARLEESTALLGIDFSVIIDLFGAFSYSDDPMAVLQIYLDHLTFSSVSSLSGEIWIRVGEYNLGIIPKGMKNPISLYAYLLRNPKLGLREAGNGYFVLKPTVHGLILPKFKTLKYTPGRPSIRLIQEL